MEPVSGEEGEVEGVYFLVGGVGGGDVANGVPCWGVGVGEPGEGQGLEVEVVDLAVACGWGDVAGEGEFDGFEEQGGVLLKEEASAAEDEVEVDEEVCSDDSVEGSAFW